MKPKDLVGMPWRIAFALQADGWYLRSDIIWSKPNPMPESVRDRPTKSHEHVFLLAKQARYFYDADAVREESHYRAPKGSGTGRGRYSGDGMGSVPSGGVSANPLGRNRRDVWTIPTRPYKGAHFATFPPALVEPCLLAGTSARGACPECGAPWRRVVERLPVTGRNENKTPAAAHAAVKCSRAGESHVKTAGWEPSCGCETQDGEPVPCIVLDPFGGSGTVAKVARDLGRSSISCELNPEYVKIAKKRLRIGEQLDSGVCEYEVRSLLMEV